MNDSGTVEAMNRETRRRWNPLVHLSPAADAIGERDHGFLMVSAMLGLVATWLLLMPVIPAIAAATMDRFHLRTASFGWWAVQQPIPSMYNFANRFEVVEFPPDLIDPLFDVSEKRFLNHFPARVVTFFDGRYLHLSQGQDRWFLIDSTYRGQKLESQFHVEKKPERGYRLIRVDAGD